MHNYDRFYLHGVDSRACSVSQFSTNKIDYIQQIKLSYYTYETENDLNSGKLKIVCSINDVNEFSKILSGTSNNINCWQIIFFSCNSNSKIRSFEHKLNWLKQLYLRIFELKPFWWFTVYLYKRIKFYNSEWVVYLNFR